MSALDAMARLNNELAVKTVLYESARDEAVKSKQQVEALTIEYNALNAIYAGALETLEQAQARVAELEKKVDGLELQLRISDRRNQKMSSQAHGLIETIERAIEAFQP